MLINKKDIIAINQALGEQGLFKNESSLDFTLDALKGKKSWLYEISCLTRSILIDHVFEDGNKRTVFVLIHIYLEENNLREDKDKINEIISVIIKNNITDIHKIMRLIKKCYQKKE